MRWRRSVKIARFVTTTRVIIFIIALFVIIIISIEMTTMTITVIIIFRTAIYVCMCIIAWYCMIAWRRGSRILFLVWLVHFNGTHGSLSVAILGSGMNHAWSWSTRFSSLTFIAAVIRLQFVFAWQAAYWLMPIVLVNCECFLNTSITTDATTTSSMWSLFSLPATTSTT